MLTFIRFQSFRRYSVLIAVLLADSLAAGGMPARQEDGDKPKPAARLKFLVPAYFYPAGPGLKHWDALLKAASTADVIAIVNPGSGPGKQPDDNYRAIVERANKAGAVPIGYVSTSYCKRPLAEVKGDVDQWIRFYPGIKGVFFDEQASDDTRVAYYQEATAHVRKKLPKAVIVNNPGTTFAKEYLTKGGTDVICVSEIGKDFTLKLPEWIKEEDHKRLAVLWHNLQNADQMRAVIAEMAKKKIGHVFLTDAKLPNPWDRLPSWWEAELKAVRQANGK